jgi:hypothetical protein
MYNWIQIKTIQTNELFYILYLHFNRMIIDDFIVSAHNDYSEYDSDGVICFTSDDEHDYLTQY